MSRSKRAKKKREKIGSFWIDSGTILLADPCQVIPRSKGANPHWVYKDLLELFYTQGTKYTEPALTHEGQEIYPAQERTLRAEHVTLQHDSRGVAALVVTVGVDGWYPVYIERDADGIPRRIIIECGGQVEP